MDLQIKSFKPQPAKVNLKPNPKPDILERITNTQLHHHEWSTITLQPYRHSFSTRLLATVIPSELYVGDKTLDAIHRAMTEDLLKLYHDGITAAWPLGFGRGEYICLGVSFILGPRSYRVLLVLKRLHIPESNVHSTGQVDCGGTQKVFRFVPVMIKGDWPYLRKAMHLRTGPTSARVCHLCDTPVPSIH